MEYISAISYFLTNEVRLFLGLFLVAKVMNFLPKRMLLLLSAAGGVLVTALQMAGLPTIGVLTVELLVITAVTWYCLRDKLNLCLFLIFFYEVGVGLWDFLLQAGLGIMFRSENFINPNAMEYLAGIWLVRLLMLIGSITLIKQEHPNAGTLRALSVLVILGMFGAVTLSEQTILPLNEDQVGTWIILSIILLFAILFYRVNQQREMEAEIAKLKQEQAEIVERDYQALRRTYADNAKLYHDLHNHIEAIYQCLIQVIPRRQYGIAKTCVPLSGKFHKPFGRVTKPLIISSAVKWRWPGKSRSKQRSISNIPIIPISAALT